VPVWLAETVPLVAVKAAAVAPPATVTEAGTAKGAQLEERLTVAPPAGAAALMVAVQVVDPFEARLPAPQLSEEIPATAAGAAIEMLSPAVAVRDALSATCAVKLKDPAAVGAPPMVPLYRLNPPGRDPETIDQVYGAVPPLALNACE
jgi:hypothetical protein